MLSSFSYFLPLVWDAGDGEKGHDEEECGHASRVHGLRTTAMIISARTYVTRRYDCVVVPNLSKIDRNRRDSARAFSPTYAA